MSESVIKSEIICKLEECINSGKRLILYDHSDVTILNLLCEKIAERDLQNIEIWHSANIQSVQYTFLKKFAQAQIKEILDLYGLYDFSDRVTVVSESSQYGSLFNYIRTGMLTPQEMADAILYKI